MTNQNLRDFYIKSHYDKYPNLKWDDEYRSHMRQLMAQFGLKGGHKLLEGQKILLESGDVYRISDWVKAEETQPSPCNLKDFFKNVHANASAKAGLLAMYEAMITEYGTACNLSDGEKDAIRRGDPHELSGLLTQAAGGPASMITVVNPMVPVIIWTVSSA